MVRHVFHRPIRRGIAVRLAAAAIAAFGEELGWRGLLLGELADRGFWTASILIGAIWGIWHAPIIALGHNFPDQPILGVVAMTGATIALAPLYTYVTVRGRTVFAPSVLHGTFNAIASLSLVYVAGSSLLVTSPVGVAGMLAGGVFVVLCLVHDRWLAASPIMHNGPLAVWDDP